MKIHRGWNTHLGDWIASLNRACFLGEKAGHPVKLSTLNYGHDMRQKAVEIYNLLDSKWLPELIHQEATEDVNGYHVWNAPVVPVKPMWRWSVSKMMASNPCICYQFDGVSAAAHTNPTEAEGEAFLNVWGKDVEKIRLGNHMTLAECAEVMSRCEAGVFVDSGMSHLAHAVGCPTFIYEKQLAIITTHRGKAYCKFHNAFDLADHAQYWKEMCR